MKYEKERILSLNNNHNDTSRHHKSLKEQQFTPEDQRGQGRDRDRDRDRERDDQRLMPPPLITPPVGMGRPGGPGGPGGPEVPGMGQPPRTAPPNFVPEAPGMERGQMRGPGQMYGPTTGRDDFGYGRRRRDDYYPVRPRDLQRCINRFTFIWLINGNGFWFYPTFVGRQFVQGFRWRRNRWEFDTINLNRIIFFRCY